MYNSRTFSQNISFLSSKCDRFQNKPSEECATTENKPKIIQQPL